MNYKELNKLTIEIKTLHIGPHIKRLWTLDWPDENTFS